MPPGEDMDRPRVAYLPLWFPKASETFVAREVAGLWSLGLEVEVISLYGALGEPLSPELAALARHHRVRRLGLAALPRLLAAAARWSVSRPGAAGRVWARALGVSRRGAEALGEDLWGTLCGFHLADLLAASRIGHVHAPWAGGPAAAAWTAGELAGIPFSFSGRAGDIHPPDGSLAGKIAAAAFVRVNNRANVDHLRALAGPQPDKIRLVYNGLDLDDRPAARTAFAPPLRLVAVGRLVRTKGFDVLLDAARILVERGLDFRLDLVGDGPWARRLRRQARELGLEGRVGFRGFLSHDRVAELMAQADLMLAPCVVDSSGDRDGIPNVIMEALAHRLPVVASDVAGIGEVVAAGQTGFLVPQRRPDLLAQAVLEAAADPARAVALAERGRRRVLEMFHPGRNLRLLAELFRDPAGPSGRV